MNGAVRVLRASDVIERAEWQRRSAALREPFAYVDYVEALCRPVDQAVAFVVEWSNGWAMFPFVVRPIAAEAWAPREAPWFQDGLCDVIGSYGYAGAWWLGESEASPRSAAQAEGFWRLFGEWCAATNVVSAFSVLPPQEGQLRPTASSEQGSIIVRDLQLPIDAIWMEYEHKVRKNVQRARSEGLTVQFDPLGEHLADFLRIYYDTMDRRQANAWYYLSHDFFDQVVADLGELATFVHVRNPDGLIISSELLLRSDTSVYSFLGGTDSTWFPARPNDLLKHEVIVWAQRHGARQLVLGGGPAGVVRYKRSFAPLGVKPLETLELVIRHDHVQRLVTARRDQLGHEGQTAYFPPYRKPIEAD